MRALGAIAAAALALGAARGVAAAPATAMTNEEVVRKVSAGVPSAEIVREIEARPAAFDLSPEMVEELKLAGVPAVVLDAMRARQPAPAPTVPDRPARGHVRVTIALVAPEKLALPSKVPDALAERLRLPADPEARTVRDVAVFVACLTPEHVPDAWRGKTPLGRDLVATPRHEMLAFVAGDTAEGAKPSLTVPKSIDAEVDDVETHDLVLGVAARIGDRWYTLATSERGDAPGGAAATKLAGRIEAEGGAFRYRVALAVAKPSPAP